MKLSTLILLSAAAALPCLAQVVPFTSGVAMGHIHLNVHDVAVQKEFWVKHMGGTALMVGNNEVMKFPGALVFLKKADPTGGSEESAVQHFGFKVKDFPGYKQHMRDAGFAVEENPNGVAAYIMGPDKVKVEVIEDKTLTVPIVNHHIHFYTKDLEATKAWYVKTFDAIGGKRGKFEAADIPGVNLTFSAPEGPGAALPTKGRSIDHIGFEVKNLEAYCKKLEAGGIKFDIPFRKVPALGLSIAFFTDPFGTYIELTEGLDKI